MTSKLIRKIVKIRKRKQNYKFFRKNHQNVLIKRICSLLNSMQNLKNHHKKMKLYQNQSQNKKVGPKIIHQKLNRVLIKNKIDRKCLKFMNFISRLLI